MMKIKWDENKIRQLNAWVACDSASSYGAVSLQLKKTLDVITSGGSLIISQNNNQHIIKNKQEFLDFLYNHLMDAQYFINEISNN